MGQSLDALADEHRLDASAAIGIILDICDALDAAHRRGIVHCDVKPSNVIVARSNEGGQSAYLLDFGIAKWSRGIEDPVEERLMGTPLFMAPEQYLSRELVTPATDVWALGLLAFYLLTGCNYWAASHLSAIFRQVKDAPLLRASERAKQLGCTAELPPWFDDWFARCVSREINQRFSTAGQAAQALTACYDAMVWTIALSEDQTFSTDLVVSRIRLLAEDPFLRLLRVERGSIVLVLMGARRGFEKVRALMPREVRPQIAGASVLSVEAVDRTSARSAESGPVDAFISYSPADMSFCDDLLVHLSMMRRQGLINEWHERLLVAGSVTDAQVSEWLARCKLFMTLLSADYIASDKCFERELHVAIEKHHARAGCLVPIIVRACHWTHPPFSHLSTLPRNGTPISSWRSRDEAWADVVRDIRPIVENLRQRSDVRIKDAS